jgi:predicted dehydrogenase
MQKINWGIIGLGKIAAKVAGDILLSEGADLFAVASRDEERAKAFRIAFDAEKYYASYESLVQDPDVDVVYVATPHVYHFEHSLLALKHGKHVLCEKPMGMDKGQVEALIEEARKQKVFLMEGLWTRFIPATKKMLEWIDAGLIGEIISVKADFGFKAEFNPESRLFNKKLGGGSLLDIGIYPVYLSLLLLGLPREIKATARMTNTGVDGYFTALCKHENNAIAILVSTTEADTPIEGYIYGTNGFIKMHSRFHHTRTLTLQIYNKPGETIELPYIGEGYVHEIDEVNRCVLSNKTESDLLSLQNSRDLIHFLDQIRAKINLSY